MAALPLFGVPFLADILSAIASTGAAVSPLLKHDFTGGCGIDVYNLTRFVLTDISVHIEQGDVIQSPQPVIPPYHHAVMVAQKSVILPLGTHGTMSMLVNGCEGLQPDRRVYIMWSAPCALSTYVNTLGVGLSTPGYVDHPKDKQFFQQMYKGYNSDRLKCEKRQYKKIVENMVCRDDRLKVYGNMNTTRKAVANVIICPIRDEDWAFAIQNILQRGTSHDTPNSAEAY